MRQLLPATVLVTVLSALVVGACTPHGVQRGGAMRDGPPASAPPLAEARPQPVLSPNGVRIDSYYWLRDDTRLDPKVLGYLNAENAYTDGALKPLTQLEQRIYEEIVARIPQDDVSVPYRKHGYWYVTRVKRDSEYPIYA